MAGIRKKASGSTPIICQNALYRMPLVCSGSAVPAHTPAGARSPLPPGRSGRVRPWVPPLDSVLVSGQETWNISLGKPWPHLSQDTLSPGVTPAVQTTLKAEDRAANFPWIGLGGPSCPLPTLQSCFSEMGCVVLCKSAVAGGRWVRPHLDCGGLVGWSCQQPMFSQTPFVHASSWPPTHSHCLGPQASSLQQHRDPREPQSTSGMT